MARVLSTQEIREEFVAFVVERDHRHVPSAPIVPIDDPPTFTAITSGHSHSLALTKDGEVWAWGFNNYGQVGNDSIDNVLTPQKLPTLQGIKAIAGGLNHSLAGR